jgi:hypothetical protein
MLHNAVQSTTRLIRFRADLRKDHPKANGEEDQKEKAQDQSRQDNAPPDRFPEGHVSHDQDRSHRLHSITHSSPLKALSRIPGISVHLGACLPRLIGAGVAGVRSGG